MIHEEKPFRKDSRFKKRLVFFGMGDGTECELLLNHKANRKDLSVVGVEHFMDDFAKKFKGKEIPKNFFPLKGDFEKEPNLFEEKSIDTAVLNFPSHHSLSDKTLENLHRWLKDDSSVLVRLWGGKPDWIMEEANRKKREGLINFLKEKGFSVKVLSQGKRQSGRTISQQEEEIFNYPFRKHRTYTVIAAKRRKK